VKIRRKKDESKTRVPRAGARRVRKGGTKNPRVWGKKHQQRWFLRKKTAKTKQKEEKRKKRGYATQQTHVVCHNNPAGRGAIKRKRKNKACAMGGTSNETKKKRMKINKGGGKPEYKGSREGEIAAEKSKNTKKEGG